MRRSPFDYYTMLLKAFSTGKVYDWTKNRWIMGKFYDGKRRWNETIAAQALKNAPAAAMGTQKRYSGRTTKLSKTMKHVDEETRAIVRNARLESLEADNYGIDESDCITDQADLKDEMYIDETVK
uniref:AlNc14C60G4442 protein n=1 Tax=Albugo laibachii Nc14 TaxID=890382 RepID=F0WCR3_9STRA|nr:AlNc14C60G4442 [Albugo laibachii Nc14]|eukprot:CCA18984.1 AlNc14C60G4442 [Albugo laibachii Nc14]